MVEGYLAPWRCGGSWLKLSSVTEQLDFLAEMLATAPDAAKPAGAALLAALERIRRRIAKAR